MNQCFEKEGTAIVFGLHSDRSMRTKRLAPTDIRMPVPSKVDLDDVYYKVSAHRRCIQHHSGKYAAIWKRQEGKCAYCGSPMLPDQELDVVEKVLGEGYKPQNLIYIHKECEYDAYIRAGDYPGDPIDLSPLMDDTDSEAPVSDSPYLELTEFFRLSTKTPLSLTFKQIEEILGDRLSWPAYFYEAFWYETDPAMTSDMWRDEGFPFQVLRPDETDYCISDSWLNQGYKIKALHLTEERVVFRRVEDYTSGLVVPKVFLEKRLPDAMVHKFNNFCRELAREYGL